MANKKNKVKFGLNNVHWAKITQWSADGTTPVYADPVRLPGAVSLSMDANGENEPFYADNCVYYVMNNNSGYEGDLEIALVTTEFATEILGEILDNNGVLVERNDAEPAQFALLSVLLFCIPSCNRRTNHRRQQGSQDRIPVSDSCCTSDRTCQVQDL